MFLESEMEFGLGRLKALLIARSQLPIRPNKKEVESLKEEPCKRWKGS